MKFKKESTPDSQLSLLDHLQRLAVSQEMRDGSFDLDYRIRACMSRVLRHHHESRAVVALKLGELTGKDITEAVLNSWTAPSQTTHRPPAEMVAAFCRVTNNLDLVNVIVGPLDCYVLPGTDTLRAELGRLEEEIKELQAERKQKQAFLKELEGKGS